MIVLHPTPFIESLRRARKFCRSGTPISIVVPTAKVLVANLAVCQWDEGWERLGSKSQAPAREVMRDNAAGQERLGERWMDCYFGRHVRGGSRRLVGLTASVNWCQSLRRSGFFSPFVG